MISPKKYCFSLDCLITLYHKTGKMIIVCHARLRHNPPACGHLLREGGSNHPYPLCERGLLGYSYGFDVSFGYSGHISHSWAKNCYRQASLSLPVVYSYY